MKLNLIEKIVLKIFKKTFEKVYKMGLTDSFNFCNSSSFTPQIKFWYTKDESCQNACQIKQKRFETLATQKN